MRSEQLQGEDDRQLEAFVEYRSFPIGRDVIKREVGGGWAERGWKEITGEEQFSSPEFLSAVCKAHFLVIHICPAKMASLLQLNLFAIPREQQLTVGGRAHNVEQKIFHSAILVLDVQERKVQWLH